MVRIWVLSLALGCGRPDCEQAVGHGMDLAAQELERSLARESPDWQKRAAGEAAQLRAEAQRQCHDRRMTRETYRCTMAAKTYQELLRCPGWR